MRIETLPAGIEWKPVRRNHWIVTIRREPETQVIVEPSDYANIQHPWPYGSLLGFSLSQLGCFSPFGTFGLG